MITTDYERLKALRSVTKRTLIKSTEAAAYLGLNAQWLAQARMKGTSPPYLKFGDAPNAPVRYDLQELDNWVSQRAKLSTTEGAEYTDWENDDD